MLEGRDLKNGNMQVNSYRRPTRHCCLMSQSTWHCCQNPCDCQTPENMESHYSTWAFLQWNQIFKVFLNMCSQCSEQAQSQPHLSPVLSQLRARLQESSTRCAWTHCFQGYVHSGNSLRHFCAQPDNTNLADLEHDKPAWFKRASAAPLRGPCSLPLITSHHRNIIMEANPSPPNFLGPINKLPSPVYMFVFLLPNTSTWNTIKTPK